MKNSTRMVMALMMSILAVFMISCGTRGSKIEERIVLNEGTTVVENGRGLYDTIPFTLNPLERKALKRLLQA